MSTLSEGELQFRCKLCQYTGGSKSEIAEHFLTEHIEVEYVSPTKKPPLDDNESKTNDPEDGGADEEDAAKSAEKVVPKKRGRPRGRTVDRSLKMPEMPDGEMLGRGMRKRKKTTPKHVLSDMKLVDDSEQDDEDGDDEQNDDDDDKDLSVEEGWITAEEEEEGVGKRIITFQPLTKLAKPRGRPRKKGKRGRRRKEDKTWKEQDERKTVKPHVKLPIPYKAYSMILRDRVQEWQEKYEKDHAVEMFQCPNEACTMEMTEAEIDVHVKCHVPNLEGYRCPVCEFMCLHWRNMRHHYRKTHEPMLSKVTCDFEECLKEFPRISALKSHALTVHIRPALVDKLKSKYFNPSEFSEYLDKSHGNGDKDATNENNSNLANSEQDDADVGVRRSHRRRGRPSKRHLEKTKDNHSAEPPRKLRSSKLRVHGYDREKFQRRLVAFICDVCHAKYNDEDQILAHKFNHYREGKEEIYCTECDAFAATDEAAIRDHMSNDHKNMLQLHRCDKCNFSSNRFHDLKKHHIVHTGAKNFMCDKCGKCTTTPYNLKVHYRRMHATDDEKNIKCISCDYKCADKAVLKDHIRQKHGLLINGDEYQNPRAMLIFPCSQCNYVGRKQSSLDYHMRIHTENRQFKCHLCPYASKTKNNLVLHIRTHEGMQPVKCPHCDFKGATNKIISEHVMCKHANSRPYRCNICGWSTAYSGNMWKHVDTHQKELGDKMPEFPVNVISTDGHGVPTPLRAPSGKKRGGARTPTTPQPKSGKMRGKRSRSRLTETPTGLSIAGRNTVHSIHVTQVQAGGISSDGVVMQVPVATVVNPDQVIVAETLPDDEAIGSNALSRLAAAVASAREVHLMQNVTQHVERATSGQPILATQVGVLPYDAPDHGTTTIQVAPTVQVTTNNGIQHHEIVEYNVPPVAVTQQIIAGGDMAQVISEHHYHQDQQQQNSSIQQAAIHAGIHTGGEPVPTAVVEQIVHDTPHHEDQAVHHLVATMIPHDAELVMSMMQVQQPNVSQ